MKFPRTLMASVIGAFLCLPALAKDTIVKVTPASPSVRVIPEPMTPTTMRQVFEFTCGRANYAVTFEVAPDKHTHTLTAITVNGREMRENVFQAPREVLSGEGAILSVLPQCSGSDVEIRMGLIYPSLATSKALDQSLTQTSIKIENPPL
jgi:hypothetical protein